MTKSSFIRHVVLAATAALMMTAPAYSKPLDGHQYLKDAKVGLKAARATALKTYPGRIVTEELERENGGSGLRYSFDIRQANVTHEVGIDAKTGAVLENSVEGPDAD